MKKAIIVLLVMGMVLTLTSCGENQEQSVEDLQKQIDIMTNLLVENKNTIESLESTIKSITGGDSTSAISVMDVSTGKQTFNTLSDKIIFLAPFEYTGAILAPNNSSINITQNVVISPSNNWTFQLSGSELKCNHTSGITGSIKVGVIKETLKVETLIDNIFKPFLANIPAETPIYGNLYLNNISWGQYMQVGTTINEEKSVMHAGLFGIGNTSVTYMFIYTGEKDVTKDELISIFVQTMKINNIQLSMN